MLSIMPWISLASPTAEEIRFVLIYFKILDSKLQIFTRYRMQGRPQEPEFCTCEDGSTFELVTVQIGQV